MRTPADLYKLGVATLAALERMADKSAANVVAAIEKSRTHDARALHLRAGHPPRRRERRRSDLARHFGNLDALHATRTRQRCCEVPDVGPVLAQSIAEFFAEPHNREVIDAAARRRRALAGDRATARGRRGPARGQDVRADRNAADA